jgi:HD-GYP domain-containing protein (c-di-GMP phosphodiesterase class II)
VLFWSAVSCAVPLATLHFFARDTVMLPGIVHFSAVAAAALAAAGASAALTVAGARRQDGRVVLVGGAFSVMAVLLLVHGISTPGLLVGDNGLVAFTGAATLPVGGAVLALSAVRPWRRPRRIAPLLGLIGAVLVGISVVSAVGMLAPRLVPAVPEQLSPAALALLGVGLSFYLALGLRAFRTWRLTQRTSDLLVVVGIVWLATALAAALTLGPWDLGWWIGHGLEVAGIALVGGVVAADLHRGAASRPLTGDLRAVELVLAEEAFLGSHVRALTACLAEKDRYTEGHARRVALLAVEIGDELGLSPGRLRTLATAGLLHDIGKLALPDTILRKPDRLTDDEYAQIKQHPTRGSKLLEELGGFPVAVRELVGSHHERLDGSGYPDGAAGGELSLETRILGVCDVYDALVSDRVYRVAWTSAQALEQLRRESGTAFDPSCVSALEAVLGRERPSVSVTPPAPRVWDPVVEPVLPSVPAVFAGTTTRIIRRP